MIVIDDWNKRMQEFILDYKGPFHPRDIAKAQDVGMESARKYVTGLAKSGKIFSQRLGRGPVYISLKNIDPSAVEEIERKCFYNNEQVIELICANHCTHNKLCDEYLRISNKSRDSE